MNSKQLIEYFLPKFTELQKQQILELIETMQVPCNVINLHNAAKYILKQKTLEQALNGFDGYPSVSMILV